MTVPAGFSGSVAVGDPSDVIMPLMTSEGGAAKWEGVTVTAWIKPAGPNATDQTLMVRDMLKIDVLPPFGNDTARQFVVAFTSFFIKQANF